MDQSSALTDVGIKLDANAIRARLAVTVRDAGTLRRLLKIAEEHESPIRRAKVKQEIAQ